MNVVRSAGSLLITIALLGCGGNGGRVSFDQFYDGTLSSGDPTSNGYYYDTYTFVADESGNKTFGMTSNNIDSYLVLEDENGNVIREDDDSGEGHDAQIRYYLQRDRTYYLLATSYSTFDTGTYTIGWQNGVTLVDVDDRSPAPKAKADFKPRPPKK